MEYYKKYRILENVELAQTVNLFIKFFNGIPFLGKITRGKYKLYRLKNFLYKLSPVFRMIFQFILSLVSMFGALLFTGTIFNLIDKFFGTNYNMTSDLIDSAASGSYAFLAFYISQALLANKIINARPFIKTMYGWWRMNPKAISLSVSFFTGIREAIGRGLAFSLMFYLRSYESGIGGAFLISFILMFISISMTAFHLYLYTNKGKIIENKLYYYIIIFAIMFALLLNRNISLISLTIVFLVLLIIFIRATRYIFNFDNYDKILAGTKDFGQMQAQYKKEYAKKNELKEDKYTSSDMGRGYEFLNNIFFERYKDLIRKPILKKNLIVLGISLVGLFYLNKFNIGYDLIGKYIPVFLIILSFIIHHNESMTKAFFEKCDRSLMSYSFYKSPKALGVMYKIRFKKLLRNNAFGILVGLIIAISYGRYFEFTKQEMIVSSLYMLVAGFYFISFVSALYYIYQPYNYEATMIGSSYKIVRSIEGYFLFFIIPMIFNYSNIKLGLVMVPMIVFMLLFMLIAPYLVKRFGPRNFKIQK